MKKRHLLLTLIGMLMGWGMADIAQAARPSTAGPSPATAVVSFYATDNPGAWFECANTGTSASGIGCVPASIVGTGQKSLAVIRPGEKVAFPSLGGLTRTVHTATSLIYPTGALGMPFIKDVNLHAPAPIEDQTVTLTTPGLYVITCSIHPYMFGAVIVDDPKTKGPGKSLALDLGESITIPNGITVPTSSDLATRLLRVFFIATDYTNWQDYASSDPWHVTYPSVPVRITGGAVVNLRDVLEARYGNDIPLATPSMNGATPGVGQVWVDTQFEKVIQKNKPGTVTLVNAQTWQVERKVALPGINMNNPHNMWTDRDQNLIYVTQWFDDKLTVFNRADGTLVRNILVGDAPAHVMTRANDDDPLHADELHVTLNGNPNPESVVVIGPLGTAVTGHINIGAGQGNPHAHWMSPDGRTMVTPNVLTGQTSQVDLNLNLASVLPASSPLTHPIATGMRPDEFTPKYYVANLLDSKISVYTMNPHAPAGEINLLNTYHVLDGCKKAGDEGYEVGVNDCSLWGALPIQTPVSPDGTNMVTANTLSGTITIVDTRPGLPTTDTVVKKLDCDPGCHGVQYGAKQGGGYYAYVSSKFSNRLLVVDPAPGGNPANATIVGQILLKATPGTVIDGTISEYAGMGGQGILPIPVVYDGWVQKLPNSWKGQLKCTQTFGSEPCLR